MQLPKKYYKTQQLIKDQDNSELKEVRSRQEQQMDELAWQQRKKHYVPQEIQISRPRRVDPEFGMRQYIPGDVRRSVNDKKTSKI